MKSLQQIYNKRTKEVKCLEFTIPGMIPTKGQIQKVEFESKADSIEKLSEVLTNAGFINKIIENKEKADFYVMS